MIVLTIKNAQCLLGQSMQIELPRPNMILDPRPNLPGHGIFECAYHDNGTTVSVTRCDYNKRHKSLKRKPLQFRVYDPSIENVPDFFNSTTYTYLGVDGEKVPSDTTVLIVDPSVKTIKTFTFSGCASIKKCILHDGLHTIEHYAFFDCTNMEVIRLPRTLKQIGYKAFYNCFLLYALFLPSDIEKIGDMAFGKCRNIGIMSLPLSIDISQLGEKIFFGCTTLFNVTHIQDYCYDEEKKKSNKDEVHQSIFDFYHTLPPLHRASLHPNVTAQTIHDCIRVHGPSITSKLDLGGMNPLHILAMNPFATTGAILACFEANLSALFESDNKNNTPLDYIIEYQSFDVHTSVIAALCMHQWDLHSMIN